MTDVLALLSFFVIRLSLFLFLTITYQSEYFWVLLFATFLVRTCIFYICQVKSEKYNSNYIFKFLRNQIINNPEFLLQNPTQPMQNTEMTTTCNPVQFDIYASENNEIPNWIKNNENLTVQNYLPFFAWFIHNLDSDVYYAVINYVLLALEVSIFYFLGFRQFILQDPLLVLSVSFMFSMFSSYLYLAANFSHVAEAGSRKQIGKLKSKSKASIEVPRKLKKLVTPY